MRNLEGLHRSLSAGLPPAVRMHCRQNALALRRRLGVLLASPHWERTLANELRASLPGEMRSLDAYVYVILFDASGQATLAFGDGKQGRIPPGGRAVDAEYPEGGGSSGNFERALQSLYFKLRRERPDP